MDFTYFECQCTSYEHVVRFTLDPLDGETWIQVGLNYCLPWYKRVWVALLYICCIEPNMGHYAECQLRFDDFTRLHDLLDRAGAFHRQRTIKRAFSPFDRENVANFTDIALLRRTGEYPPDTYTTLTVTAPTVTDTVSPRRPRQLPTDTIDHKKDTKYGI